MRLLDTNVFVRWIARDDPAMTEGATAVFERLESGEEQATLLEAVLAEVVYVLTSPNLYDLSRPDVSDRLALALSLPGLVTEDKPRCLRALQLWTQNRQLSFVDSLLAAAALQDSPSEVYSFDRGFDRVEGLMRIQPARP